MSAIAGVWSRDGSPAKTEGCKAMLSALECYGADRSAFLTDGSLAMGGHLLRLLPEDQFDAQPLCLKSDKGWLIADARIDNRATLARAFDLSGTESSTLADSGFVLRAWERWGEDCVQHLIGAFSIAVWQPARQRLFLARDHTGERPLSYCQKPGLFAFASMPKGLLALPEIDGALDDEMLAWHLAILPRPEDRSLFRDLKPLPHGHCLTVTPDSVSVREYWHPRNTPPLKLRTDEEYLDAFRDCLDEAVRCRLRTTGAIGTELSGGLDSSSVTASAALLLAESGGSLTAFTHVPRPGFKTPEIARRFGDEGPFAADVAALYPNVEHVLVPNGQVGIMKSIRFHVDVDDQPLFNPTNAVWTDAILDEAQSRGITTMLTGRAGNGTISYEGFLALSDYFRSGRWLKLAKMTRDLRRNGFASLRAVGGVTVLPLLPVWVQGWLTPRIGKFDLDYSAVNPELAKKVGLVEHARNLFNLEAYDVRTELDGLFTASDSGNDHAGYTAGWRLEMRDPTADKRIFEFIHSIPIDQFVRDGWMRSLVRRAMRGRLPESTLQRYARGLQAADWHESMAESLLDISREMNLLERSPLARRVLDLPRMRQLSESWPSEGFYTPDVQKTYHYALSRGLGMGGFIRRHDPEFQSAEAG
jgi:asparagine synthase (glutamine-hydrolysing)